MVTIGSLCTGYGGLDIASENVTGAKMIWCSEIEKYPSRLIEKRFPGVPNHGDMTLIDWEKLPPVDILTGGYPCQPFSKAGLKRGSSDERHLWPYIRQAIRILRPKLSIFENVSGHRSLGFDTVLRDCAEDGLNVRWTSVRASDAGAPHSRERLFFTVTNPDGPRLQGDILRPRRSEQVDQRRSTKILPLVGRADAISWDEFESSIRRWERITGYPVPAPTEPNALGRPRLTAAFHEWMLGLAPGWVTDIDMPYGAKIKLTGNGVVIQQGELAIRQLTS